MISRIEFNTELEELAFIFQGEVIALGEDGSFKDADGKIRKPLSVARNRELLVMFAD